MAWRSLCTLSDLRRSFLAEHAAGVSFELLLQSYGISKSTAYALLARVRDSGEAAAVVVRSRAPHAHPNALPPTTRERVLRLRKKYGWGPKKLYALYVEVYGLAGAPSVSSIGNILAACGEVRPYRPRKRRVLAATPLTQAKASNDVWAFDHKGPMRKLGSIEPLNVIDLHSRFWIGCAPLIAKSVQSTKDACERWFDAFGPPKVIRVDAGSPWVSVQAPLGLTKLSVWWLSLGIRFEVAPTCQANGCIERLHGTMERDMNVDGVVDVRRHFERHRNLYNNTRPHEALGQRRPAAIYLPSKQPYVPLTYDPQDDGCDERRAVTTDGSIKWRGSLVFISEAFEKRIVGLRQVRATTWSVHSYGLELGVLEGDVFHATRTLGTTQASQTT